MKVTQISEILNNVITQESLGIEPISEENLEGLVTTAQNISEALGVDNYIKALTNRIGKVVFVNRSYKAKAPNVLMDGWTFGSILQKIDMDMPETSTNESWGIFDGSRYNEGLINDRTYDQDIFKGATGVRQRFFNGKTTYEIDISIPWVQVEESFGSIEQLNAFFDMIYVKINNKMELNTRNLTMRTINNFIGAKLYYAFSDDRNVELANAVELAVGDGNELSTVIGNNSNVSAINLLGMYKETNPDHLTSEQLALLTPSNCILNLSFVKFASYQIALFSDRISDISTLFNMGERERFTPKDRQHLVLLSEFAKSADVYLQSDTFHEEFTKLPESETVIYWQGSGSDYSFSSTSKIMVSNTNFVKLEGGVPVDQSMPKRIQMTGVLGVLFDEDALGICNMKQRVHNHENKKGEFTNLFYKNDAQYFNDYHENFIVFFVA